MGAWSDFNRVCGKMSGGCAETADAGTISSPVASSAVKIKVGFGMFGSITYFADRIIRNLCSDFAGQNHSLPGRKSFRGLFVRCEERPRLTKIVESNESTKRRSRCVLGFR